MFTYHMKSEMGTNVIEMVKIGYGEQMFPSFSLFTPPATITLSQTPLKRTPTTNIYYER